MGVCVFSPKLSLWTLYVNWDVHPSLGFNIVASTFYWDMRKRLRDRWEKSIGNKLEIHNNTFIFVFHSTFSDAILYFALCILHMTIHLCLLSHSKPKNSIFA